MLQTKSCCVLIAFCSIINHISLPIMSSAIACRAQCQRPSAQASMACAPRAAGPRLASFTGMKATGKVAGLRSVEQAVVAAAPRTSAAARASRRQATIEAR